MHNYVIENVLGQGSYGDTYKVKNIETNEYFCKKTVVVPHQDDIQKILEEGKILSTLDHINIVKMHKNYFENGKYVIIMEFAPGGDLWQLIERRKKEKKPFSDFEIMFYFVQLVVALNYIHRNNVIHRDIKPKNILIKDDLLLVADFGVSKLMNDKIYTTTTTGTPQYLSPEICNKKMYTNKTDVWSLGVLLYELMTLSLPFEGKRETLIKNLQNETTIFKPVNHSNEELSSLLFKLLCRDQNKRFSTQDIFNQIFIREFIETHMVEFYKKYNFDIQEVFKPIITPKKPFTFINHIDEDDSDQMFLIMQQMKDRMKITSDNLDNLLENAIEGQAKLKSKSLSKLSPDIQTPSRSPSISNVTSSDKLATELNNQDEKRQINENISGNYNLLIRVANEIGFNIEDYCFETHGMLIELLRSKLEGKDRRDYSKCYNYLSNKENLFLNINKQMVLPNLSTLPNQQSTQPSVQLQQ